MMFVFIFNLKIKENWLLILAILSFQKKEVEVIIKKTISFVNKIEEILEYDK
jgi:hypothetical protein